MTVGYARTGDCREVLRRMIADGVKVQMCVTSPPYWGLRDYNTATWEGGGEGCDHRGPPQQSTSSTLTGNGHGNGKPLSPSLQAQAVPYKSTCAKCGARRVDKQIGLEETPEEFVATMVEVFRLVREVLADDGTLWLNLGDSYAGPKGNNRGDGAGGGQARGQMVFGRAIGGKPVPPGLKPKDLCGMPWRVAFALQADGWYLRSDIIWHKPNPMPESVTDRPTKSHEYLFLLTKNPRYYYDAEAVREKVGQPTRRGSYFRDDLYQSGRSYDNSQSSKGDLVYSEEEPSLSGRNRRTVWIIPSEAFADAHFATFPRKLVEPCIMAGTSEKGHCPECGAQWVRVMEREVITSGRGRDRIAGGDRTIGNGWEGVPRGNVKIETTGWQPTCTHNLKPVPDCVLDLFAGAGTVPLVAQSLGRRWTAIELNPAYAEMIDRRTRQSVLELVPPDGPRYVQDELEEQDSESSRSTCFHQHGEEGNLLELDRVL